ncbi:MAG: ECF transporter S component [Clostridiaceae bacterium]
MYSAKKMTYSALFLAFGLIVPQAFHLFGGSGPVFLPMHIPVLLAGFFLGGPTGAIIGLITPILSSLVTAMPQPPILYFMMAELTAYGFLAGYLFKTRKLNIYVALIGAMIGGRIILAGAVTLLQPLLGFKLSPAVYLSGALLNGIPGMILQLFLIPVLVRLLNRANQFTTA